MSEQTTAPRLSGQFSKALVYAELKHHNQVRKGGEVPYVGHLLSVAGLVIDDDGTESQAIAALLHDCVEDAGGPRTLAEIAANFGDDVARIVAECSDTDETPKPPWRTRKQSYLDHLAGRGHPDGTRERPGRRRKQRCHDRRAGAGEDTLLVSVADKLDNARAMLRDFRTHGPRLWERFTVNDQNDHLWYYRGLIAAYRERGFDSWMVEELGRVVDELAGLVTRSVPAVVV